MIDSDKSNLDEDYLDNEDEFESDSEDTNDFDPNDDGGLFTADDPNKKKVSKFKVVVIILSLLSGAGIYYYNKSNTVLPPPAVTASVIPAPAIPTPVSDFDTASAAIDANLPEVLNQTEVTNDLGAPPADKIEITPTENVNNQPDASTLQPVVKADEPSEKNELEAARETINEGPKEKLAASQKTVYFDAPKGKALMDIPPPSINPMGEPGESIIIVRKGGNKADAVIEKGEDNGLIETRLVNASRASSLGRYDAALGFYNEVYKKNPRDPRILMGRAVTLQRLGEIQPAIEAYKEVLAIEPNRPEAITNLMGLTGKTQPAVALQNLLDLREKYPKNADVAAQLGVAYTQSGNSQDGLKYLNMAAGLQPENPQHFYNMAVIYDHMKEREKAIKYYEQSLDVYAVNGSGSNTSFSKEQIYDRLSALRGN